MKYGIVKIVLCAASGALIACGGSDYSAPASISSSSAESVVVSSSVASSAESSVQSLTSSYSSMESRSSFLVTSSVTSSSIPSASQSSSATQLEINALFNKGGSIAPFGFVKVNAGETKTFSVQPDPNYKLAGSQGCASRVSGDQVIAGPITQNCVMNVSFVRIGSLADQLKLTDRGLIRCITELEDKSVTAITATSITELVCGNLFDPVASYEELTLFPNLESLSLTSIRLTGSWSFGFFQHLKKLNLQNNQLESVDVSQNSKLTHLDLGENRLTQINLAPLVNLTELSLDNNQLSAIDLSRNTQLKLLDLEDNQLQALQIAHLNQLIQLNASRNQLTNLDYSKNVKLVDLVIGWNLFDVANVSMLPELAVLNLGALNLKQIDLSSNKKLVDVRLMENKLTALDVSMLPLLTNLSVYKNQLSNVDLSFNTKLTDVNVLDNRLTGLDLSKLTDLRLLWATYNQITRIDLSNNTQLQWVLLNENKLTTVTGVEKLNKDVELDFRKNPLDAATISYLFNLYDKQGYKYLSF